MLDIGVSGAEGLLQDWGFEEDESKRSTGTLHIIYQNAPQWSRPEGGG
jgi:hypothetical protein